MSMSKWDLVGAAAAGAAIVLVVLALMEALGGFEYVKVEPEFTTVERVDFACWTRGAMMPLILEDIAASPVIWRNRDGTSIRGTDKDGDRFWVAGCYFLRTHEHTDTIYPAYNVMERARDAVQ